ncbi:MAG: hypothetical protein HY912_12855 [Desulfomonile tiedjei]|uniref:Uncharacterized protein n=1 Tax=Desulfomonile tiedjei TaxID=2358 RepID=A0A9D6Z4B8_9BACT|nr:hypothetical protein [Desulfomonile tiedjei]
MAFGKPCRMPGYKKCLPDFTYLKAKWYERRFDDLASCELNETSSLPKNHLSENEVAQVLITAARTWTYAYPGEAEASPIRAKT